MELPVPCKIDGPAKSSAEVVKLDNEENAVRGETYSSVELCLKQGPFRTHGEEEPPIQKVREVGSRTRKLSSSMVLV